jgi:hypothetical protein
MTNLQAHKYMYLDPIHKHEYLDPIHRYVSGLSIKYSIKYMIHNNKNTKRGLQDLGRGGDCDARCPRKNLLLELYTAPARAPHRPVCLCLCLCLCVCVCVCVSVCERERGREGGKVGGREGGRVGRRERMCVYVYGAGKRAWDVLISGQTERHTTYS